MTGIIVIADDLTGAADAGVMFCPFFRPVLMVADLRLGYRTPATAPPRVLAVHTDSRALAPEAARQRLRTLLQGLEAERLFKKIDSSLRGNIGAEADAIIDATDAACSFICAAFPELGRTTAGGMHAIHGVPVAATELSRDPVTPVTDSRIAAVVAAQSRHPVGHVDLAVLDAGLPRMLEEVARLRARGCVHLTFDATRDEHLARLVELAAAWREKVLLAGTAGLAQAAARQWGAGTSPHRTARAPAADGYPLYVCGTAAARTAEQVAALKAETDCPVCDLEPGLLADPRRRPELTRQVDSLLPLLREQALVLKIAAVEAGSQAWPAAEVARGLGLVTAALLRRTRPLALFCSGGDTAAAVITELSAWGSELCRLVVPGTVLGILRGGILDGVPLVTKPGSFGQPRDLVELHRDLMMARRKGPNPI